MGQFGIEHVAEALGQLDEREAEGVEESDSGECEGAVEGAEGLLCAEDNKTEEWRAGGPFLTTNEIIQLLDSGYTQWISIRARNVKRATEKAENVLLWNSMLKTKKD